MESNLKQKIDRVDEGWLGYDKDCQICVRIARFLKPWVRPLLPDPDQIDEPIHIESNGSLHFGGEILFAVARRNFWAKPIVWLGQLPFIRKATRWAYLQLAKRRHCANGQCELNKKPILHQMWCVPALATLLAIVQTTGWAQMTLAALGLWITLKCFLLQEITPTKPQWNRMLLWWIYPGTDARNFFATPQVAIPKQLDWFRGMIQTTAGACLIAAASSFAYPSDTYGAAIGLLGLVLFFHFGVFHLIALQLQRLGIHAKPIMKKPLAAKSVVDLWSNRWNLGFSIPARRHLLKPFAKRIGIRNATWSIFLVSGLLHEIVLTLPARSGYGGPTLYFLIQAVGIEIERHWLKKHPRINRLFVWGIALLPLPLLIQPLFLENVIHPFLQNITHITKGALP